MLHSKLNEKAHTCQESHFSIERYIIREQEYIHPKSEMNEMDKKCF